MTISRHKDVIQRSRSNVGADVSNATKTVPSPRAVLTNGHIGHVPRAPGFFLFLRGPQLAVVK